MHQFWLLWLLALLPIEAFWPALPETAATWTSLPATRLPRHRACGGVARVEGIAGAPFTIYYGEVSGDSDGPVEFCWPVPSDQAAEIAARFNVYYYHQEAFVGQGRPGIWSDGAKAEVAIESLVAWASEHQRQPSDVRMVLVFNPANQGAGPDTEFAVALR